MKNVIETEALSCRFGRTTAVDAVTLAIPSGAVVALLGPNGAGKSTLLKLLAGLQRPTSGRGSVLGRDITNLKPNDFNLLGYTAEEQRLPHGMTIRRLIAYTRTFYSAWDDGLAERLVKLFALPPDRKLSQLSRGMRAKAALTVSLAYRPQLLLLDEPLSGIDIVTREEIMAGVLELVASEGGLSMLLSSHDIDDVERLVDWVVVLMDGKVRASESLQSLQDRFQKVEILPAEPSAGVSTPMPVPDSWWPARIPNAKALRFTHTSWTGEASLNELRRIFPNATVTAESMSLRQIYRAFALQFNPQER